MDNYEKLMALPGVENCHPKFIAVVDGKREFVAEVVDGTVYLTDAGKQLLATAEPAEKPAKRSKKTAEVVQSANESASEFDDLNLSE